MAQTIFCDLDGTVFQHAGDEILDGVQEQFYKWVSEEAMIILVTGRKESLRKRTEEALAKYNLPYDLLIMGLPRGERIIVNDRKPSGEATAGCYSPCRNEGLLNYRVQMYNYDPYEKKWIIR